MTHNRPRQLNAQMSRVLVALHAYDDHTEPVDVFFRRNQTRSLCDFSEALVVHSDEED